MARSYRYISGDSHLEIDSKYWLPRVPARYREQAPHLVRRPDGQDVWFLEGREVAKPQPFDLYGGKGRDVWQPTGQTYDNTPGTGPATQRIAEQDRDGIEAEVLFPAQVCGPRMLAQIKDHDTYLAVIRAYNEWLAEEYCGTDPERLFGVGILPWTGLEDAIAEMEHCKKLGFKLVLLGVFPSGKGMPTSEDDRFWAASLDMNMPVTIHVEIDRSGPRGGPLFHYAKEPAEILDWLNGPVGGVVGQTARFARTAGLNAVQLVVAHTFDRFPNLKVYLAENSIGWVPFFLRMADIRYGRHRWWAERMLEFEPLSAPPSEIITEHFYWGFQEDPIGVELRRHMGVKRLIWGSDFPHQESEWPNSMSVIERNFADVPEEEKRDMVVGNIIDFLHLEGAVAVDDKRQAVA